jgi:hypothetical protein
LSCGALGIFSFFIALFSCQLGLVATFDDVKAGWQPSDTVILDRHGELLHRLRTNHQLRRGPWVALADVSPALRTALVLSEDKRFYEHSGVDWQAVTAAAWANLFNRKTRGASTITMQLAGLLDTDLKRSNGGRSVLQKVKQTVSAEWLEQRWRKDQILEAYLNLVPFRGELVGIDALSQTLFGKAPHGLDEREAAIAAALVRAPNAPPAQVAQRACAVLAQLQPTPSPSPVGGIGRAADGPAGVNPAWRWRFSPPRCLQRRDYASSAASHPIWRTSCCKHSARPARHRQQLPIQQCPPPFRTTLHAPAATICGADVAAASA